MRSPSDNLQNKHFLRASSPNSSMRRESMPTVKIRDNGTGIPTDVRDISNPFFTSHHAYGAADTKRKALAPTALMLS